MSALNMEAPSSGPGPVQVDGGKNPTFQEKFVFTLIEGLRELIVNVWNNNTLTLDDFIGSGKVQLQKVLSQGFDDTAWPIQTRTGRHAGEVQLIIYYANANRPATTFVPSAPPYGTPPPATQYPVYSTPPPTAYHAPSPYPSYPPNPALSAYVSPPELAAAYPHPPPQLTSYLHQPYSPYPPQPYPPQSYPPPLQASPYYPPLPGPYPGTYPPPPY
ncbi:extensin-like isoform X2 [Telopea speciosissima]|uniref:extensin-like isoform X2 n=1 Tax=Telopea speciosissima TaxID=54955 RepID=UPI001CC559A9|nr:extensin-like isoform X2 [Telopea speciosissima]